MLNDNFRKMTIDECHNINSHCMKELSLTYQHLVDILGKPYINNKDKKNNNYQNDDYKTDVIWAICSKKDKTKFIMLWNYKTGLAYLGNRGTPIKKLNYFSLYYTDKQIVLQLLPEVIL